MTDNQPIIVTWNCGHCDVIHEQAFGDSDTDKQEVMRLCMMIVMNEDVPDFQVRVLRDGVYHDDTKAMIVAMTVGSLMELLSDDGDE